MKHEIVVAKVDLECFICNSRRSKDRVELYSEQMGRFFCAQCGYLILEVTFRFEITNIGMYIQYKTPWTSDIYHTTTCLSPGDTYTITFKTQMNHLYPLGETTILIMGDQ